MMACLATAFNVEYVDIEEALAEVAAVAGERPRLVTTRPGQPWVGLTSAYAVHIAHDDRTRARIRGEAERLAWAARNGIPVPAVVEAPPLSAMVMVMVCCWPGVYVVPAEVVKTTFPPPPFSGVPR